MSCPYKVTKYDEEWKYITNIRFTTPKKANKPYYVYYTPEGYPSIIAKVPNTFVSITMNKNGSKHIRWIDE